MRYWDDPILEPPPVPDTDETWSHGLDYWTEDTDDEDS